MVEMSELLNPIGLTPTVPPIARPPARLQTGDAAPVVVVEDSSVVVAVNVFEDNVVIVVIDVVDNDIDVLPVTGQSMSEKLPPPLGLALESCTAVAETS